MPTNDPTLDQIHAMLSAFANDNAFEPTHILIDPRLWTLLRLASWNEIGPIDPKNGTVFGLSVIEVYRPYPFIAIARIVEGEKDNVKK